MKKKFILFSLLIVFCLLLVAPNLSHAAWPRWYLLEENNVEVFKSSDGNPPWTPMNQYDYVDPCEYIKISWLYTDGYAVFYKIIKYEDMQYYYHYRFESEEAIQTYHVEGWGFELESSVPPAMRCYVEAWWEYEADPPMQGVSAPISPAQPDSLILGIASPTAFAYSIFDPNSVVIGDSAGISMWYIPGSSSGYGSKTRFHNFSCSQFPFAESSLVGTITHDTLYPGQTSFFYSDGSHNTEVALAAFDAVVDNRAITLNWQTGNEIDNLGFNVYRSESSDGEYTRINTEMISTKGSAFIGTSYSYTDENVVPGVIYYYKLEDLDVDGFNTFHGPVMAKVTATTPTHFALGQNYPNPFNASTMISYTLKSDADVTLKIYNILGQEVKTLLEKHQPAGTYTVTWDGKDSKGNDVASGIYFYQIKAGEFSAKKKMAYLK